MKKGDLTQRVEVASADEIGQTATAFNEFVTAFHNAVRRVLGEADPFRGRHGERRRVDDLPEVASDEVLRRPPEDGVGEAADEREAPVVAALVASPAFAAGLAHALALKLDMAQALPLAVRWGAAKVTRLGSFLDRESVRGLLKESTGRSSPSRT